MILNLTELSNDPLDTQIAAQLRRRILSGDYREGDELPDPRALARRQHVNVTSVLRAYEALEREGMIRHVAGRRYEVTACDSRPQAGDPLYSRPTPDQPLRSREQTTPREDTTAGWHGGAGAPSDWARIESELDTARQIQAGLLPKRLPDEPWLRVAAYSRPSLTVGGDFYDVIALDEDRVGVVIADAAGKGLPAAMMISQIHGMLRSEIRHGSDIPTTLRHVNDLLAEFSGSEKFATLFYGIFDRRSGVFEFANAGHDHPIVMRADGTSERLEIGGTVLGILRGAPFVTGRVAVAAGDLIFLYTDGVTETRDRHDEEYGEDRLIDLLRRKRDQAAQDVIRAVLADVSVFEAPGQLHDDRTFLVLKAEEPSMCSGVLERNGSR